MTICYTCSSTLPNGIYGPKARCDRCIEATREERCSICDTPCTEEQCGDCIAGRCELSGRLCVYMHCFCTGCQEDHYDAYEGNWRRCANATRTYGCLPAKRVTEYCFCGTCEKVYYKAYEDWRIRKAWAEWEADGWMEAEAAQT